MTQANFDYVCGNMYDAVRNEDEFALIWVSLTAWSTAIDFDLEV